MQRQSALTRGFTLIELMIVVFVIGVIMGIAIPSYLHSRERAQEDICRENRATIDRWLAVFVQTEHRTPEAVDELIDGGYISPTRCPAGGTWELRFPEGTPEETAIYHPIPYVRCSVHGSLHETDEAEEEEVPEIEVRPIERPAPLPLPGGGGLRPIGNPLR
ncbi:MAG TPA: prepilin-type N-terminal cleavage/methylation domain-containing protein [Planctomycetota bacterium]|nr:prepilin-type N-terminal cleavage/methylation domain-containing protein [Planctomycetota bacterium]